MVAGDTKTKDGAKSGAIRRGTTLVVVNVSLGCCCCPLPLLLLVLIFFCCWFSQSVLPRLVEYERTQLGVVSGTHTNNSNGGVGGVGGVGGGGGGGGGGDGGDGDGDGVGVGWWGGEGVVRVRACLVAIQPHARSQSTRSPLAISGLIHCASGAARSAMYWAHKTKTTLPRDDADSLYACASAIDCVRAISHAKGGAHQIGSHLIRWRVCSEPSQNVSMAPIIMITK